MNTTLAQTLNDYDRARVYRWAKSVEKLPTWYDSVFEMDRTISRDFEIYLILLNDIVKSAAITQVTSVAKLQEKRLDRDAILLEAINNDLSNADEQYTELSLQLSGFDTFVSSLDATTLPADVVEIGTFLDDLQQSAGELTTYRDRMYHLKIFLTLLRNTTIMIDSAKMKQLNSWIGVFSAYRGTV